MNDLANAERMRARALADTALFHELTQRRRGDFVLVDLAVEDAADELDITPSTAERAAAENILESTIRDAAKRHIQTFRHQ